MTEILFTAAEGKTLAEAAENLQIPLEIGKDGAGGRKFSPKMASSIEHKVGLLRKALHKASPLMEKTDKVLFGKEAAYEKREYTAKQRERAEEAGKELDEHYYVIKNKKVETPVELSGDAIQGIFWICYLWLHPCSPGGLRGTVGFQQEFAWPIVRKIKRTSAMKDELGLTVNGKQAEDLLIKDDDELEAARKAEEEEREIEELKEDEKEKEPAAAEK